MRLKGKLNEDDNAVEDEYSAGIPALVPLETPAGPNLQILQCRNTCMMHQSVLLTAILKQDMESTLHL